ncbi:2-C-methyl-D-erythritol 4-phosphate cytidylyltransferase [Deinococcus fonticola]|uniref:2-C-methyl-D-erythritol 4-phosphate cytidylyltransferase n=1 Tax=Deinococcus fonticola TaxID=2528713 RepID=UPI001074C3D5|nr:2-C-methyl-D-erythritol 4-phosphate cytidylyltransferase [Deinococcus fonticola]
MTSACVLSGTTAALIPAAGSGSRLGRGPKAFVEVRGQSLLARSVAALRPLVDEVVVALPEGMELPPGLDARAIVGGATRQDSVARLLRATSAEYVLIHDAARPFLPENVVLDLLEAVHESGAATLALPVADTLVRAEAGGNWGDLTPREGLWAVQTPQAFRRELILKAHAQAVTDGFAATDDAGLVARLLKAEGNGRVRLVPGDARLFKVTTPGDLALAEALAAVWEGEQA